MSNILKAIFFLVLISILIFVFVYKEKCKYNKIPKIIFQTYPGNKGDSIPDVIQKNIKFIKKLNPEWDYKLYRDNEIETFIKDNYPPVYLNAYKKINDDYGAAKADFFRYLLMYKYGGVYLDIKSSMYKPLNDIIENCDEYILANWPSREWGNEINYPYGEFQQWHIMCRKKHPYLKEVIEQVLDNVINYKIKNLGVGKTGTLRTTGPIVYTKSILPILNNHKHKLFKKGVPGLIYDFTKNHESLFKKHYSMSTTPIVL